MMSEFQLHSQVLDIHEACLITEPLLSLLTIWGVRPCAEPCGPYRGGLPRVSHTRG